MALPTAYTNNYGKISDLLKIVRDGTAPEIFNRGHLRDLGFKSSHDFSIVRILKELGFLSSDGKPTSRYMNYLDKSKYRSVLGEAVREVYNDIFVLRAKPSKADLKVIEGKFKSEFNSSDNVAKARANTFLALLSESELRQESETTKETPNEQPEPSTISELPTSQSLIRGDSKSSTFHYNLQIHLPPSKDVEVYNAIFKSLKEHLID